MTASRKACAQEVLSCPTTHGARSYLINKYLSPCLSSFLPFFYIFLAPAAIFHATKISLIPSNIATSPMYKAVQDCLHSLWLWLSLE